MPQILFNLDANEYHANPSLSNSLLKHLAGNRTPLDFWRNSWMNPTREDENKDSTAKKFGRAAHMLILEGEEVFNSNWGYKPGVKTTKEEGMLGEEEYSTLMNVRDQLMKDPVAKVIFDGAKTEVSMFADMPVEVDGEIHMVPVRCRHDLWKPSYSIDPKFQDEVHEDDVVNAITNFGYDFQAGWYPDVMALCQPEQAHQNFGTLFIEKRKRGPIKILWAAYHPEVITEARRRMTERLKRYVRLVKTHGEGQWPGFDHGFYTVCPPGTGGERCLPLPNRWNYQQ